MFGKKEDGSADFSNSYTIDWDDRFDENILADIPDLLFTTVGLEKTDKDTQSSNNSFISFYEYLDFVVNPKKF